MADHFERGGERQRAVPWLLEAAEAAHDGLNLDATLRLANRGLACGPSDADRGSLLLAQTNAFFPQFEWAKVATTGREAMRLLPVGSVQWFTVAASVLNAGSFLGDPSVVASALEPIMKEPVRPEPSGPYAAGVLSACAALAFVGQSDVARSILERAEALGGSVSDPEPIFVLRLQLARGRLDLAGGQPGRALAYFTRARKLANRIGDRHDEAWATLWSAFAFSQIGDCESVETATREVALFSEATLLIVWSGLLVAFARITTHGGQRALETIAPLRVLLDAPDALLVANARVAIALALIEAGDLDGAEREATLVLEYVFVPHMPWMALGALALVALRRGEHGRALALAERGLAVTTKCFRRSTTDGLDPAPGAGQGASSSRPERGRARRHPRSLRPHPRYRRHVGPGRPLLLLDQHRRQRPDPDARQGVAGEPSCRRHEPSRYPMTMMRGCSTRRCSGCSTRRSSQSAAGRGRRWRPRRSPSR